MNRDLTIGCPQCNTQLVLPSSDFLGKQVSCPRCQQEFLAESSPPTPSMPTPAASDSPFAINTSATHSRTTTNTVRTERSSGSGKRPLILAAAALGIVLLAGLSWTLLIGSGAGRAADDLNYMADDTDLFLRIQVAEILESPLLTRLLGEHPAFQAVITAIDSESGLTATNIDSVAIGMVGVAGLVSSGSGMPSVGMPATIVVRLREPVDLEKLIRQFAMQQGIGSAPQKSSLQGNDYYKLSSPGGISLGLCVINETTFVAGPSATVETVIRRGNSKAVRRFDFIDATSQLLIGIAPLNRSVFDELIEAATAQGSPTITKASEIARGKITATAWGLSVRDSVDFQALFQFTSADDSARFTPAIKKSFAELNQQFSSLANAAEGDQARAVDLLIRLLTDISVGRSGTTTRVDISISKTTIDLLIAVADGVAIPDPGSFFATDSASATMNDEPAELGGGNTKLILTGVNEESLSKIVSMFEDPEFIVMEYLDRWLTSNVAPAVTVGATIDGEEATIVIIGLDDFSAFADKIDFGEVTLVDKANTTVFVTWDGPEP